MVLPANEISWGCPIFRSFAKSGNPSRSCSDNSLFTLIYRELTSADIQIVALAHTGRKPGYSQRGGSSRQRRLTLLQEAADRGVALETDCDFVGVASFAMCARLGQQLHAYRPVGLVFGEPHIGGYLLQGVESGAGTLHLRDRQGSIDGGCSALVNWCQPASPT